MINIPWNIGTIAALVLIVGYLAPRLWTKEVSWDNWMTVVCVAIMLLCMGLAPEGIVQILSWRIF